VKGLDLVVFADIEENPTDLRNAIEAEEDGGISKTEKTELKMTRSGFPPSSE